LSAPDLTGSPALKFTFEEMTNTSACKPSSPSEYSPIASMVASSGTPTLTFKFNADQAIDFTGCTNGESFAIATTGVDGSDSSSNTVFSGSSHTCDGGGAGEAIPETSGNGHGGNGGDGGGAMTITSAANVITFDFGAMGIFAQSIGGDGGAGGSVYSGTVSAGTSQSISVTTDIGTGGASSDDLSAFTCSGVASSVVKLLESRRLIAFRRIYGQN